MKLLLLLVAITLNNSGKISAELQDNNAIENLHIDFLVQRYLHLENDLWNYVYSSGAKSKDIIFKIRSDHSDFFSNSGLDEVINDVYRVKFERFLNLTEFDNYAQEDLLLITLAEQPTGTVQSGYHATSVTIINNYNRIVSEDLFSVIKEVSLSIKETIQNTFSWPSETSFFLLSH